MKLSIFVYSLGVVFFFMQTGIAYSIESIGSIPTIQFQPINSVNESTSSAISTVKSIGLENNYTPQNQNADQSLAIPTIPVIDDTKINISSIPPTIIPIDKKKGPPAGLFVKAPKELFFPERSVSTAQQWTVIDPNPDKPITIVDDHEGNAQWDLTVSADNFKDGSDTISIDNLSLFIDTLVASKGNMQNIYWNKNIQFKKQDESYPLVHKDGSNEKGIYDIYFGLKLSIPPNTSAGHFRTEIVLTII